MHSRWCCQTFAVVCPLDIGQQLGCVFCVAQLRTKENHKQSTFAVRVDAMCALSSRTLAETNSNFKRLSERSSNMMNYEIGRFSFGYSNGERPQSAQKEAEEKKKKTLASNNIDQTLILFERHKRHY